MRILLTALAALTLAGCHAAAPDSANGAAPNEASVEGALENQQAELAASIENDANADDAEDGNLATAPDGPTAYSCDSGITLTVAYTDDGNAGLTTGGKTLALKGVPSASGNKYHSDTGLAPNRSLTWWTKGDGAMLIQGPKGAKDGGGETTVNCLATDADQ
jgi:membrane-bound inhibitor of C-type lysozyme